MWGAHITLRAYVRTCEFVHVCTFFFPFCGSSKCITHPLNNRRSIAKTTMFSQHTHTSRFSLYRSSLSHCMRFFSFTYFLSSLWWLCVRVARMHLGFVVLCVKCRRSLHYYAFIMKIEVVCFIYIVGILCFVDVSCRTHIERIILFSIAPDLSIVRWTERKREREMVTTATMPQWKCNNNTPSEKRNALAWIYIEIPCQMRDYFPHCEHIHAHTMTMTIYHGYQRLKRHNKYETLSNLHAQQKYTHRHKKQNLRMKKNARKHTNLQIPIASSFIYLSEKFSLNSVRSFQC